MRVCHQCGAPSMAEDRFCRSCGAALFHEGSSGNTDPLVGRTIGGTYVLQEIIGVGGMGRVYRAEQTTLGRTVAIKVIHPHLLGDEQTVARFYTEARAASRLNHPHSVSVIDFGRTEDGILYLAMEFLKGKDLALVMHEEGPLPFKRICDVLVSVLDALGEAHALDIVHRDLKPENIILRKMRTGEDLVKVVDFGLATIVGGGSSSITRPGLVCGTPDYMAPEQGRGEHVDGRGDLYAVGVVLFELLTDQLPFEADTPTKVVLRHINDPIPDPRQTAPHRQIPDVLGDICVKALSKKPADRFQTAAEMSAELRRARAALDANRASTTECPVCGTKNPSTMRFCGACGVRLTGEMVAPTSSIPPKGLTPKPSFYPPLASARPFVGREPELERLDALAGEASKHLVVVGVEGEIGVGKTRLLREAAERYAQRGWLVAGASPHPSGALLAYGPLRQLAANLLELDPDQLATIAQDEKLIADPLARAGIAELAKPEGLRGVEDESRAGAVASGLAMLVRLTLARRSLSTAMLVVDDVHRCDGLTLAVLRLLRAALAEDPILLVLADARSHVPTDASLELGGLELEDAGRFLTGRASSSERRRVDVETPTPANGVLIRRLLPFYLEQIHALGGDMGDDTLPPRLADAVAQRVERLPVRAQRALQCLSAFGGRASRADLAAVADPRDLEALDELIKKGLVAEDGDRLDVTHPFLAELVEAFIPASARRELHQKILDVVARAGAPLEIQAEHAYRANVPMRTFMILERCGDLALARGDGRAAVVMYRRALELSRREMLENGDTVMDTALVTFSRKLGWALAKAGDLAGADGVVREALDLTGPYDGNRARMHLVLGRVAALRERPRDAMRHFGQALEIVAGVEPEVEQAVQLALGRLRRDAGDPALAGNAFRRALELLDQREAPADEHATVLIELGEVSLLADDAEEAELHATRARELAAEAGSVAVEARALGLLARAARHDGRMSESRAHYEAARAMAARAGDSTSEARFASALAV
ncbi:MAG: protein kinase [Sandaracinus sp.]|nr:protein kinase [Sandaracinus sp.]